MQITSTGTVALGAFLILSPPALAQDGTWLLERIDSTLNAPQDIVAVERMTLVDADGSEKVRILNVYQQGPERRMVKFMTPAEVRDAGFLRLAEDQMYLYLPAFRRVRRIASSIKNEAFMGTDLSYEDLSRTSFGDDYDVVEAAGGEDGHTLTLQAKPGADVSYGRMIMQVQPDTWVITELQLFDQENRPVKTIAASRIEQVGPYWMARRLEVTTLRDGHKTILELDELQVDTGLDDDFFSQRQLKRRG